MAEWMKHKERQSRPHLTGTSTNLESPRPKIPGGKGGEPGHGSLGKMQTVFAFFLKLGSRTWGYLQIVRVFHE